MNRSEEFLKICDYNVNIIHKSTTKYSLLSGFESFISHVKKEKFEKENRSFLFILSISNWFVCLVGFYGISNFVGYLMPNRFLYK